MGRRHLWFTLNYSCFFFFISLLSYRLLTANNWIILGIVSRFSLSLSHSLTHTLSLFLSSASSSFFIFFHEDVATREIEFRERRNSFLRGLLDLCFFLISLRMQRHSLLGRNATHALILLSRNRWTHLSRVACTLSPETCWSRAIPGYVFSTQFRSSLIQ